MKKIVYFFIISLFIISCGGKSDSSSDVNFSVQSTSSVPAPAPSPAPKFEEAAVSDAVNVDNAANMERKLIITVDVRINSRDVEKSYKSVENKIKEYNGYFDTVESSKNRYYLTIRVPKDNLYNFINFLEETENIENKNINTQDVTDTYYDTENRIKNREVLLEKLRAYLREAKSIDEILKVEDRINTLTYEIETMKGEAIKSNTNIYNKYLNLISFLKEFFSGILFFLVGFVAVAIPVVLILALFYYICFGKIGLIKKLYRKIK